MGSYWGIPIHINAQATNPVNTDVSTADTIRQMIALAISSASDPHILSVVDSCLAILPSKPSKRELVRAIFWWVKRTLRFTEDEEVMATQLAIPRDQLDKELLIAPSVMVQMPNPTGDCDDYSMLLASLLVAVHIKCWYVTIATDDLEPTRFSHVYVKAWLEDEGQAIALDGSHGTYPGWECKQFYRRIEWAIN